MKLNHEWPDGSGKNYKSILDKEKDRWRSGWSELGLEDKQRHVKYLSDLCDYSSNPQFFRSEDVRAILNESDCDILIIPSEFHEENAI